MIITNRISFAKLLRNTRGNLLFLLFMTALAAGGFFTEFDMSVFQGLSIPAGFLGTALAFLIGFRSNSAYERWWEARRIWGKLVNDSRLFSMRVLGLLSVHFKPDGDPTELAAIQKTLTYRHCAFVWAMDKHLRKLEPWGAIRPFLDGGEIERLRSELNVPMAILRNQELALRDVFEAGYTDSWRHMQIDALMENFNDALGQCERIKNTPFPKQYTWFLNYALWVFLLMLPFSLESHLGLLFVPFSIAIGYVFIMLEYVGRHIESPFENTVNDTPMDALSRTIEINLRQNLGETDLPPAIKPVDGYLY